MSSIKTAGGSRMACGVVAYILVMTLTSCAQESPAEAESPRTRDPHDAQAPVENTDDLQAFGDDGSGVSASGTVVRIRLPSDQSRLLPGPPQPLVDGTACLTCHDPGEVAEFAANPQGPNYEVTNEFCRDCHSADYISSQPPLDAAAWQKVVKKMVDKFDPDAATGANGAEPGLNPEHQKLMVEYLAATYGQ